jgi:hypothetical protein
MGAVMTEVQPEKRRRSSEGILRLDCPRCPAFMNAVPMLPGLGHLADRIFKCGKCGHILFEPE